MIHIVKDTPPAAVPASVSVLAVTAVATFDTVAALAVDASLFNADGIAALIVHGQRARTAEWHIAVLSGPEHGSTICGKVHIFGAEDPDQALEAAFAWGAAQCAAAGLKIALALSDNHRHGPRERPYFVLGRLMTVAEDWS